MRPVRGESQDLTHAAPKGLGYGRLTISAASTDVRLVIPRLVDLAFCGESVI
jgi:hypothetical protein